MKPLRTVFYLCFLLCMTSCFSLKPVVYKRTDTFTFTDGGSSGTASIRLLFNNPNSFGCTVSRMNLEGELGGKKIFTAAADSSVRAGRRSDFTVAVTAVVEQLDFNQLLNSGLDIFLSNRPAEVHVTGNITLRKFLFRKKYELNYREQVDKSQLMKMFGR